MASSLHPAENRGYRELYASARHMANHWSRVAKFFEGSPVGETLTTGASEARALLTELAYLTKQHDLYGHSAAQGTGAALALARSQLINRGLERNQALRFALLDLEHLNTLLAYLLNITAQRGDADLERFTEGWQHRLAPLNTSLRNAIAELGRDPDEAVAPLDRSIAGRITHGAGWVMGSIGEATDRITARFTKPRLPSRLPLRRNGKQPSRPKTRV
jgi:hypothetical protein